MRDEVEAHILGELREMRKEVSLLRADVAVLKDRQPSRPRQFARDGGLATGGAALATTVLKLIENL